MAGLLGLTRAGLETLETAGIVKRKGRDQWPVAKTVQGYIAHLQDTRRQATKTASLVRVQDARTREIELRTAREEHKLIDIEEALAVIDQIIGQYRALFDALPSQFTKDPTERARMRAAIDAIYSSIASEFQRHSRSLRQTGEAAAIGVDNVDDEAAQA